MYLTRTPRAVQALFKSLTWRMSGPGKDLYLTFDDGPIPEVTPWVLDTLAGYGAKATFFCVGRNAQKHPELLSRIRMEGHSVGNHTFDHVRGRSTSLRGYLRGTLQCQAITKTSLFRPPYGSLTMRQLRVLRSHFTIVMWDVLSGDFDRELDAPSCLRNVIDLARPGSIVVFHDSLKAEDRLRHALPGTLAHFAQQGYDFKALPEEKRN
ncbi:MAG TPA: polysaccharide deacetylase family protein [Flavobacteriales bacterium]|nr:polysaccharide deacetylase family protein [Flavobacteriales bacterium]